MADPARKVVRAWILHATSPYLVENQKIKRQKRYPPQKPLKTKTKMNEKRRTISEVCNNPLNIRYNAHNQWKGQIGQDRGFCQFKNIAYGFRAAFVLIGNYIKTGCNTIEDIINRWAPPSENDTEKYIEFVCHETIIPRDLELTDLCIHDYWTKIIILQAMAKIESGVKYDENQINLFINYPEKY